MSNSISQTPEFVERRFPFNVNSEAQKRILGSAAPRNLGVAIIGFANAKIQIDDKLRMYYQIVALRRILAELVLFPNFRRQFLPVGVDRVTVKSDMYREHEEFVQFISPNLHCWRYRALFLQVALFDGQREFHDGDGFSLGIAANCIDRWKRDFGSADLNRMDADLLGDNDAELYAKIVGDSFSEGIGVWPDSAQAFRNAILAGSRAYLDGGSMAKGMMEFHIAGSKQYWEWLDSKR